MSDDRMREAERRWRETGRLEDRVRWWSERARAGALPPGASPLIVAVAGGRLPAERVELAAYLGDPGAQALAMPEVVERVAHAREDRALRVALGDPDVRLEDVVAWVAALRLWDRKALLRGWSAGARQLMAFVAALDLSAQHDEESWLAEHREHRRAWGLPLAERSLGALEGWLDRGGEPAPGEVLDVRLQCPWTFTAVMAGGSYPRIDHLLEAVSVIERAAVGAISVAEAGRRWSDAALAVRPDVAALRAAVRDALVPWALREAAS